MNKEHALKNLKDVEEILTEMEQRHFIIDGTLLGYYREKDFIEHDLDIDFGVFADDWSYYDVLDFLNRANMRGFNFWCSYGDWDNCFEFAVKRHGIKVDLFFYRPDGNKIIFHAFRNGGNNLPQDIITYAYPKELFETLKSDTFLGVGINTPNDVEKVLELKYGNWKEIIKKWDWADSPHNKI